MLCYYDDPKPPSPVGWWDYYIDDMNDIHDIDDIDDRDDIDHIDHIDHIDETNRMKDKQGRQDMLQQTDT